MASAASPSLQLFMKLYRCVNICVFFTTETFMFLKHCCPGHYLSLLSSPPSLCSSSAASHNVPARMNALSNGVSDVGGPYPISHSLPYLVLYHRHLA